ncbi:MAG: hypothetical protein HY706_17040 [Candidatus Hydrogenedentes bacterium]|nr:hypothetical protein [Candidatus Hydrogenedentota bacterium]
MRKKVRGPVRKRQEPPESKSLRDKRKRHIEEVLAMTDFDMEQAAQLLEISVTELEGWISRLGIVKP